MLNHQKDNQQKYLQIPNHLLTESIIWVDLSISHIIGKQVITIHQQGIHSTLGQDSIRTQVKRMKGGIKPIKEYKI